jgi:hypothetical protein
LLSEYRCSIPISATNRHLDLLLGLNTFRSIRLRTHERDAQEGVRQ